jgi:putative two-component system response regulator
MTRDPRLRVPESLPARILILDDDVSEGRLAAGLLESAGYECHLAESAGEARVALDSRRFDLVICDVSKPGEAGMTLVRELEHHRGIGVLMSTEIDDPAIAHELIGRPQVHGYLTKPYSDNDLLINVDQALEQAREQDQREKEGARLRREAELRAESVRTAMVDVAEQERVLDEQRVEMLVRLSEAVGRRDLETGAHIRRIGEFCGILARASGLPEDDVERIRRAAPMHDVGKVAVRDAILLKPGLLDSAEREEMEHHAQIGHDILAGSDSPLLELAGQMALTHHERVDGSGYPTGLKRDEIPLGGRLVAVADVFDALVSDRPYREAMPVERAVGIMQRGRGTHFDGGLFDLFLDNLDLILVAAAQHRDEPGAEPPAVAAALPGSSELALASDEEQQIVRPVTSVDGGAPADWALSTTGGRDVQERLLGQALESLLDDPGTETHIVVRVIPTVALKLPALMAASGARPTDLMGRLVVEVREVDAQLNLERAVRAARTVRDHGAGFGLTEFGELSGSMVLLREVEADHVCLAEDMTLRLEGDDRREVVLRAACDAIHGLGAKVLAARGEGVPNPGACAKIGIDALVGDPVAPMLNPLRVG